MIFLKKERNKERKKEKESPAGLHIGGMIVFLISHLKIFFSFPSFLLNPYNHQE